MKRRSGPWIWRAAGFGLLWLGVTTLAGISGFIGTTHGVPASGEAPGTGVAATAAAGGCGGAGSLSPDSVLIPLAAPTGSLATGSTVTASYQAQLNGAPLGLTGAAIHVPSLYASFRTTQGSSIQIQFSPAWVYLSNTSWSNPLSVTHRLSSGVTFASGNASFSSSWLAVTSNASYGSFEVQFHWKWTTVSSSGATVGSPWSSTVTSSTTHAQPSTFYPAPYVRVASTSGTVGAASGSTFTAKLTGNVTSTTFRMVIETSTGKELNSVCLTSGVAITSYNASIPLTYSSGTGLPSGNYLAHVHNAGGAIVVSLRLSVK